MCLTIPKQVLSVKKGAVVVEFAKSRLEVASLVSVKKGDWVLTQDGVIVRKIRKKDAEEINKLLSNK